MSAQNTATSRKTRDYSQKMTLQEKNYYIEKFRMKMADCLPSTAAEWIDGINKGTESDLLEIFYEIRNDIDWASKDPQREKGDMPAWYNREIYDPKMNTNQGSTYNREGKKVRVTIPVREEEVSDDDNPAFLYNTTNTSILVQIANGEVDANYLARVELANRGLDKKGVWVGFKAATRIHNIL